MKRYQYQIPLPDEQCRQRLIELYSAGIDVRVKDPQSLVARTAGVSAAFIRELMRRATLLAIESDGVSGKGDEPIVVTDEHLDAALNELMVIGGKFTQTLLGARPGGVAAAAAAQGGVWHFHSVASASAK